MRLELSPQLKQQQTLKLAPQLIQSIEILQLPALDLQDLISQQLEENPALELSQPDPEKEASDAEDPREERVDEEFEKEFERLGEMQDDWDEYLQRSRTAKRAEGEKDRKLEALNNTASKPMSIQDHLLQQFSMLEMSDRLQTIGENIIYNIDRNGYLQYGLSELIESIGNSATLIEAEEALHIVQRLDPPGIGGRTTQECLLLQLNEKDPNYELYRELLQHYLEEIKRNRIPHIAKKTGRTIDQINDAIQAISKLNLRPGATYSSETAQFIIPDVIVECIDGEYVVTLENGYIPELRISNHYRKIFKDKSNDKEARLYIKEKIDRAKWLIDSIQQRRSTLYNVSCKIVEYQSSFLDKGLYALRELKMQDVADDVGIHVSTVSRAIHDKYVQTHRGIFPLKFFFTGAIKTTDGADESRVAVKHRVEKVVQNEDKRNPLSDEEIGEELRKQGVRIARRTVTKYRKQLKIPSSRRRKVY